MDKCYKYLIKMESLHGGVVAPQYAAGVIVNLLSFIQGATLRTFLPILSSTENSNITNSTSWEPDEEFLQEEEYVLWCAKYFYIGGIISAPFFGYFANVIGRKKMLITIAIFLLLSYIPHVLFEGGFFIHALIAGPCCAGVAVIVPMYVGEIAKDNIRGVIGSFFNLSVCLGLLFGTIVKYLLASNYHTLGLDYVIPPVLCISFLAASLWLPESPIYSMLKKRTEDAKNALFKLRGSKNLELIEKELENLEQNIASNDGSSSFIKTITDPATKKAIVIGCNVVAVGQLSRINRIMFFMDESIVFVSPDIENVLAALLPVIGAIFATGLIERAGRKGLLFVSSGGMALAIVCQLFWILFEDHVWLTAIAHVIYIVSFHVGFGSVPWILLSEIFKTKIRGPAISFCVLNFWALYLIDFFVGFEFNVLNSALLGVNCVLFSVFIYFFIPETKGKSLELILTELGDKKAQGTSRLI